MSRFKSNSQIAGFTLVEVLVVVTLTVMLMLTASSLFMTFLIGNTKTSTSQLVKAEGTQALNQMEFLIRNSVELVTNLNNQKCVSDMDSISFLSIDNGITTLFAETDTADNKSKIASNSGIYLTSGSVDLTQGPTFSCQTSSDGLTKYVTIDFTLRKGTPGVDQARDIVEERFTTGVTVRSF